MNQAQQLLTLVDCLVERSQNEIDPIEAVILAASWAGIASDSRSVATKLGLSHALVIRGCVRLSGELQLLDITKTSERSHRIFYAISAPGARLLRNCSEIAAR